MSDCDAEMVEKIEVMRRKLNELVQAAGVENKEVLRLSRELDQMIVQYLKSSKTGD